MVQNILFSLLKLHPYIALLLAKGSHNELKASVPEDTEDNGQKEHKQEFGPSPEADHFLGQIEVRMLIYTLLVVDTVHPKANRGAVALGLFNMGHLDLKFL